MSKPVFVREDDEVDDSASLTSQDRVSVRGDDPETDIDNHLTLSSSDVRFPMTQHVTYVETPVESTRRDHRDTKPTRDGSGRAEKRSRSRSRNSRRGNVEPRMPHLNWKPPARRAKLPQLADVSDDEDDGDGEDFVHHPPAGRRSRSNSKLGAHGASLTLGERIFQEELEKASHDTSSENNRQRRQRLKSRKKQPRHYTRAPSDDDSDISEDADAIVDDLSDDSDVEAHAPSGRRVSQEFARDKSPRPEKTVYRRKGETPEPRQDREATPELVETSQRSTDSKPQQDSAPSSIVEPVAHKPPAHVEKDVVEEGRKSEELAVAREALLVPGAIVPEKTPSPLEGLDPKTLAAIYGGIMETKKPGERRSWDDLVSDLSEVASAKGKLDDTGDIEKSRHYVEDARISVEEDAEHEFKAVQNTQQPLERIVTYCRKYIVSFLNANGGVLYFGVQDDGIVKGVAFSRRGRDMLRLGIDMTVSRIKPQVDPQLVRVILVPVEPASGSVKKRLQKQGDKGGDHPQRFVVEVRIGRGDAPVYLTSDGAAYFRRSGSVYRMDQELIQRRMERGRPLFSGDAPQLPREFIGRERELEQIREYILQRQNNKYALIVLHGLPMTGKSTLGRQLVDNWASLWPDGQFMIDLKGTSSHYIHITEAKVSVIRAVYPILQLPESKAELDGIFQSCFTGKRVIIFVENAGKVDQIKQLLLPAVATAKSILCIVTSRRDLPIEIELEGKSVKLSALDEQAASKLFKAVMADRGPPIPDETILKLVRLAGCMPLPVRMLAANIARMPNANALDALLQTVDSDDKNRIEILFGKLALPFEQLHAVASTELLGSLVSTSPPQKPKKSSPMSIPAPANAPSAPRDVSHLISASPLSAESIAAATVLSEKANASMWMHPRGDEDEETSRPPMEFVLSLSVFPSTFDLVAVSYLWGLPQKETGTILQYLVDSNEIDLSADKLRYSQNDLFKSWCQQKALEVFGEEGVWKWQSVFVEYYLDLMNRCTRFVRKSQLVQGLDLFSQETPNFERAIAYAINIGRARQDYRSSARLLLAISNLNACLGTGEQKKWDRLKAGLEEIPEVVRLAEQITAEEQAAEKLREEAEALAKSLSHSSSTPSDSPPTIVLATSPPPPSPAAPSSSAPTTEPAPQPTTAASAPAPQPVVCGSNHTPPVASSPPPAHVEVPPAEPKPEDAKKTPSESSKSPERVLSPGLPDHMTIDFPF